MFTVDELTKELKVSRNTIISLIKSGHITAIKVGSQYRIPKGNLDKFITASEVTNTVTFSKKSLQAH